MAAPFGFEADGGRTISLVRCGSREWIDRPHSRINSVFGIMVETSLEERKSVFGSMGGKRVGGQSGVENDLQNPSSPKE